MLMADGAKETPAAVRGRTWHRGGSAWEREARANQGSTAWDCGSGARRLQQVRLRERAAPAGAAQAAGYSGARRRCRAGMQGTGGGSRLWGGVKGME